VLSEDQKLGQYQSTGPFALTQTMSTWQHQFSEQFVTFDFGGAYDGIKFDLYQGQYMTDVKKSRII
jgi:hypothetical protein